MYMYMYMGRIYKINRYSSGCLRVNAVDHGSCQMSRLAALIAVA